MITLCQFQFNTKLHNYPFYKPLETEMYTENKKLIRIKKKKPARKTFDSIMMSEAVDWKTFFQH